MTDPHTTSYAYTFSNLFRHDMEHIEIFKNKLLNLSPNEKLIKYCHGIPTLVYSYMPWCRVVPNRRMLPFLNDEVIGRKMPLLRTRDIKPGLGGILRDNSRIKEFRLQDAILHSYIYDIRFISALCVLLGFYIWCTFAPEPLVLQPLSLSADPKIEYLNNIVTDTYVNKICSSHPGRDKLPYRVLVVHRSITKRKSYFLNNHSIHSV